VQHLVAHGPERKRAPESRLDQGDGEPDALDDLLGPCHGRLQLLRLVDGRVDAQHHRHMSRGPVPQALDHGVDDLTDVADLGVGQYRVDDIGARPAGQHRLGWKFDILRVPVGMLGIPFLLLHLDILGFPMIFPDLDIPRFRRLLLDREILAFAVVEIEGPFRQFGAFESLGDDVVVLTAVHRHQKSRVEDPLDDLAGIFGSGNRVDRLVPHPVRFPEAKLGDPRAAVDVLAEGAQAGDPRTSIDRFGQLDQNGRLGTTGHGGGGCRPLHLDAGALAVAAGGGPVLRRCRGPMPIRLLAHASPLTRRPEPTRISSCPGRMRRRAG
jgi:hypothetical protein